ncbi:hypothetical protein HZC09_00875 [Candidatus Micrarchaeota archaeon]|nr:hypothetical protein [Candidatus Micrarchaeota archaeon]
MVKFSAEVVSIYPAQWPDGRMVITVIFGTPVMLQSKPDEQKNILHIQIPNQSPVPPIQMSHRFILFFSDEEWKALKCKPTYGDMFTLESTKDGFKIEKEGVK